MTSAPSAPPDRPSALAYRAVGEYPDASTEGAMNMLKRTQSTGRLVVAGAVGLAILVAAFESGMRRYAPSASPLYGSHRFDMDLRSSRLLGRREEGHG